MLKHTAGELLQHGWPRAGISHPGASSHRGRDFPRWHPASISLFWRARQFTRKTRTAVRLRLNEVVDWSRERFSHTTQKGAKHASAEC